MEAFIFSLQSVFWFLVLLTIVVFIHEMGHYLLARKCGVRVETFSIGFGKELFGFNDKHGTRWRISMLPFGGYVKMFGDFDPIIDAQKDDAISDGDRKHAFHYKSLWQKAQVVVAGPLFNYLSAFIILVFLLTKNGIPFTEPVISEVLKDSPAAKIGLMKGDEITEINGSSIESFEDVRQIIMLNYKEQLEITVQRGENEEVFYLTPEIKQSKDVFGNVVEIPMIGVQATGMGVRELTFAEAVFKSLDQCVTLSAGMLKAMGQIITGERGTDQLGGPIKIAQYSAKSAEYGVDAFLWFIAMISINLGLVNLIPLPMLDGGHLLFYAIEAIRGKPLSQNIQFASMKVAFVLLIMLMLFVTLNDIRSLL